MDLTVGGGGVRVCIGGDEMYSLVCVGRSECRRAES